MICNQHFLHLLRNKRNKYLVFKNSDLFALRCVDMSVLCLRNTSLHLLEFIFEDPDVPGLLQKNFICYSDCRYTIAICCISCGKFRVGAGSEWRVTWPGRNSRLKSADNKCWHWQHEQEGRSVRVFLRNGTESGEHLYSGGGQFKYRLGKWQLSLEICGFLCHSTRKSPCFLGRSTWALVQTFSVQMPIASQIQRSKNKIG
jgi:hypothetical protein